MGKRFNVSTFNTGEKKLLLVFGFWNSKKKKKFFEMSKSKLEKSSILTTPLILPCGVKLPNRIAKSAMTGTYSYVAVRTTGI